MSTIPTRFQPGQSGNPGGRPKKNWSWSQLLEVELEKEVKIRDGVYKYKELVARAIVAKAAKGDVFAIRELFNRMDGMPTQSTDLTSKGKEIATMTFAEIIQNMKQRQDATNHAE